MLIVKVNKGASLILNVPKDFAGGNLVIHFNQMAKVAIEAPKEVKVLRSDAVVKKDF